jgi:restriction endonuclease S subunit
MAFPFPSLDEQRRIAEVLRSVDEAIAAANAVIGQLRETRPGALMALPGTFRRIDEFVDRDRATPSPKQAGKGVAIYRS